MPNLIMLVGPSGSGKSTYAMNLIHNDGDHGFATVYINQDEQGKEEHFKLFKDALLEDKDIIVDRMNFSLEQRNKYLDPAKMSNYSTKILCLHENFDTCLERMEARKDHPTIKDKKTASKALNFFFSKYERVQDYEADEVVRIWPDGQKPQAVICDLDGTLCNIEHRLHYVRGPGKKNWKAFFEALSQDSPNMWCKDILEDSNRPIVLCSGRTDTYWQLTTNWLSSWGINYHELFMRNRSDYRDDSIVKEILLDFEILTRYTPYYIIDDRDRVCKMWRKRGYTVLQCAEGLF